MRRVLGFVSLYLLAGLVLANDASAYTAKETKDGALVRWFEPVITVKIGMPTKEITGDPAWTGPAIRRGYEVWADELEGTVEFQFETVNNEELEITGADRVNVAKWINSGWDDEFGSEALALTFTSYRRSDGEVVDADIAINSDRYDWHAGSSCRNAYDVQNVVAHEAGHLMGLAHSEDHDEATMYPSSGKCETKKRDLATDDQAGIVFLYLENEIPREEPTAFGCAVSSTGTRGRSALLLVLAVGFLGLLRRRFQLRRAFATLVGAALALTAVEASATIAKRLPLDDLATKATVVARGEVVAQKSFWLKGRIYTDSTVRVAECMAGSCARDVVVRQMGGEVGDMGMTVSGVGALAVGQEAVLFLRARRDGSLMPVGMAQGVFHVMRDSGGKEIGVTRNLHGLVFVDDPKIIERHAESFRLSELRALARKGAKLR